MEEIYSEKPKACRIAKARPETISFLMAFSGAYNATDYNNLKFEQFLN